MRFVILILTAFAAISSVASAAPPLTAYGRLPAIEEAALSATGDRFAVVTTDKGGRKVVVRSANGDAIGGLAFGAMKVREIQFAGDDHLLVFVSATVGRPAIGMRDAEWMGIVDLNLKTRANYMIFNKSNTFVDAVLGFHGVRQSGGRWYAYVGAVPLEKTKTWTESVIYPDLYRVDLETGRPELVASSTQHTRNWLIGGDGQVMANALYDPDRRQWTVYAGAGADRPLLQRAGVEAVTLVSAGRAPGTVVVRERTGDSSVVHELRLDGAAGGDELANGDNPITPLLDQDSQQLVGLSTVTSQTLFDPILQKRINAASQAFPGERSRVVAYSRGFDRLIFLTNGPKNPGRYWLFDVVNRTAAPVGDVWPEVGPDDVGPTRMFAYKAADGLDLEGVLTLPPGGDRKALALVVMPHGGPIQPGDQVDFNWWAQAFASRGYAVLQPNYRGTRGTGDALWKAADGELGRKMQTDISDGVGALAGAGIVDPKRVCIVGSDFGGYAALLGVTLQQGLYRCAVSVAGVSDLGRWLNGVRDRGGPGAFQREQVLWRRLSGTQAGAYDAPSPVELAAKADAPIMLVHGERDTAVSVDQSRMMERALKQAGKPVELVVMDGEDHWLSSEATRQVMLTKVVAFVQKHDPAN